MAKFKGVKWAQILTLMSSIAKTLVDNYARKTEVASTYATKSELTAASGAFKASVSGSTLIFPSGSTARVEKSTLVLVE